MQYSSHFIFFSSNANIFIRDQQRHYNGQGDTVIHWRLAVQSVVVPDAYNLFVTISSMELKKIFNKFSIIVGKNSCDRVRVWFNLVGYLRG